jgi:hypothetical protein
MSIADVDAALRTLALSRTALTAVVGTRVFISNDLPVGYDVRPHPGNAAFTGPAVLFSGRGGRPNSTSVLLGATYIARCYGVTQAEARELDALLLATLHDASRGRIRMLRCQVTGQHTPETDTGWHTYLSTWELTAVLR